MPARFELAAWSDEGRSRRAPVDLRAYVVTDPGCNASWGRSNADAVRAAVAGGATIVQVREKDADGGATLQEVSPHPPCHRKWP